MMRHVTLVNTGVIAVFTACNEYPVCGADKAVDHNADLWEILPLFRRRVPPFDAFAVLLRWWHEGKRPEHFDGIHPLATAQFFADNLPAFA